ncbi:hypothetical protein M427DRAFT_60671, partial [Gonapodya prolifera JEL478]
MLANDAPCGEGIVTSPAFHNRMFQYCFSRQPPDQREETDIFCLPDLCGSDSKTSPPGTMVDVVKRVLAAYVPFDHYVISASRFVPSWTVEFQMALAAHRLTSPSGQTMSMESNMCGNALRMS